MKRFLTFAFAGVWFCQPVGAADSNIPALFRDVSQPLDKRVDDLIGRLTLEEKATLLNHRGPTVQRFNIRSDQWNQCLNGVKWDRPTTLFPACIAMAATWDTNLVHEVATILSDEARAIYNGWHLDPNAPGEHKGLIYRAPVINIGRNPYWGRNHEAWGEDPFLVGRMAVSYVKGLQGDDPQHLKLAATLKHYAVNNVETDRHKLDAQVSERMLREYWLPHFRDAVVEGKAQSLMASYNAINGKPNTINHWLLTGVLKNEWQHEGFVVSDLGGVKRMVEGHEAGKMGYDDAVAQAVMAGCDFSDTEFETQIPIAVRAGKLTEARLDDALRRVLRTRMRLGEFDPFEAGPYSKISPSVIGSEPHRSIALKTARESIVLLKNNGILPLDPAKVKRLAVIGPLADVVVLNNYNGKPGKTVSALQGIRERVAPGTEVVTAGGCEMVAGTKTTKSTTKVDTEIGFCGGAGIKFDAAAVGEFVEFTVTTGSPGDYDVTLVYKGARDRGRYVLTHEGEPVGTAIDQFSTAMTYAREAKLGMVKFQTGGPKTLRFTVAGKSASSAGFSGSFDKLVLVSHAGKKSEFEFESLKSVTGENDTNDGIPAAVALSRDCDAVIVCVGTDRRVEHEGRDRKSLGLTGRQEELVKAVLAANSRTIVVQMSAGPLTVPWLKENAPAMLQAWWGGEEGGHALADVLFGNVNPAGRLPHTVYASETQVPSQDEYDITKGFTYMYLNGDPLFAFGHGLGYTTFAYSGLKLSQPQITVDGAVEVSVEVVNTGRRTGDEVVQLYVRDVECSVKRPAKELRGFHRISLKPGEKRTVTFVLPGDKLAFWDEKTHAFLVEPGDFEVLVGASSEDIRARGTFSLLAATLPTVALPDSARAAASDDILILSFFRGNGQAGIFLASSEDGLHFKPLNDDKPAMKPAPWAGQNLTRDPSIIHHDGKFRTVWTTSWTGDCFAYAESKDLVTWSEPVRVEPFGEMKPKNTWAPEICWDPLRKNYFILWSSSLELKGNRIYMTRTSDGKAFAPAQLFLDRPFACIDAFPLWQAESNRWVLIYKNEEAETKGGKNLRVATAPLDFSKPWVDLVDHPIIGPGAAVAADSMTEGPTLLRMSKEYFLYWDSPLRKKQSGAQKRDEVGKPVPADSFGMASSTDLKTWTDHTAQLSLPTNVRHGTVFRAPRAAVGWLHKPPIP